MEQFKRAKVIMLPTENILENGLQPYSVYAKPITKSGWLLPKSGAEARRLYQNGNQAYHLYIISDDEIKDGDWFIMNNCIVRQCKERTNTIITDTVRGEHSCFVCKKIIATTDTSLKIDNPNYDIGKLAYINLPQPSQEFIDKYIQEYNKGNIIADVLVEYENLGKNCNCGGNVHDGCEYLEDKIQLKINPKDNTITIKKLKDSWNREEVYKIIRKAIIDTNKVGFRNISMDYNKWIEENL